MEWNSIHNRRWITRVASRSALVLFFGCASLAQSPQPPPLMSTQSGVNSQYTTMGTLSAPSFVTITIGVRDARGMPLDVEAVVRLTSPVRAVNLMSPSRDESSASFANLLEGIYDVEVKCPGYRTVVDRLDVTGRALARRRLTAHRLATPGTPVEQSVSA